MRREIQKRCLLVIKAYKQDAVLKDGFSSYRNMAENNIELDETSRSY